MPQAILLRKPTWPLLRSADSLLDRTWAFLDSRSWATEIQCACSGSASRVLLGMAAQCLLNLPEVGERGTNRKGYLLCHLLLSSHVSCPSRLACTLKSQAASRLKTDSTDCNKSCCVAARSCLWALEIGTNHNSIVSLP